MPANLRNREDVVARTLWGEARGDGWEGMHAVGCVILNRASHPSWWGFDPLSVCLDPWQFSCWNADDPNRPKLLAVTEADEDFANALRIARALLRGASLAGGEKLDVTGGADSYFATTMPRPPSWAARAVHTVTILRHSFWRVQLPSPDRPDIWNGDRPDAPNVSLHSADQGAADALNAAELARIRQGSGT